MPKGPGPEDKDRSITESGTVEKDRKQKSREGQLDGLSRKNSPSAIKRLPQPGGMVSFVSSGELKGKTTS